MSIYSVYPTKEQEKIVEAFLEALEISFVKEDGIAEFPPHVFAGIAQGQADIKAGRFITLEEFQKRFPI